MTNSISDNLLIDPSHFIKWLVNNQKTAVSLHIQDTLLCWIVWKQLYTWCVVSSLCIHKIVMKRRCHASTNYIFPVVLRLWLLYKWYYLLALWTFSNFPQVYRFSIDWLIFAPWYLLIFEMNCWWILIGVLESSFCSTNKKKTYITSHIQLTKWSSFGKLEHQTGLWEGLVNKYN